MAIGTQISQQRVATTRTQQHQPSIMNRMFSWLQLSLVNIFRFFFPARGQLAPSESARQTSHGRIYDNVGPAVSVKQSGPVNIHTNIGEREIRSPNTVLPSPSLPAGVSHYYRNKGMVLEAENISSINTTTNIGTATNDGFVVYEINSRL